MRAGPIRSKIFWAFAAIYVVWGSTYLAIQIAIETMPPFLLAGGRFLAAGAILFAWALWQGEAIPAFPVWRSAALLGSLFFVLGNGLVVWAVQHVPSGRTALLASTSPIWTVLIESALDKWRPPKPRVVVGIGLGIIGLAFLTSPSAKAGPIPMVGLLGLVIASMSWAAGAVLSHRRHLPVSPTMATGLKMIGGGAQLTVLALVLGEGRRFAIADVSTGSWLAAVYLVIFGSVIGFTAFTYLLRETTPQMVGTSSYVNPLVAVFLGWALASEPVTSRMLLGAAVSLSGVVLIRWPTATPQPADEPEVGAVETGDYPVPRREA